MGEGEGGGELLYLRCKFNPRKLIPNSPLSTDLQHAHPHNIKASYSTENKTDSIARSHAP